MKYLISIAYDGSKFYGFQRLKGHDTVQKKIEEALSIIAKETIEIKGAGRTDRGVHAYDQKATFNLNINIDEKLGERKLGNLEKLRILGRNKKYSYTIEQLLDENLKNTGGESRKEVTKRMEQAFNKILSDNIGKRVAIISHGAAIKFLLMKWCKLNKCAEIEFRNKVIILNTPGILKLIFENKKLIDILQVI